MVRHRGCLSCRHVGRRSSRILQASAGEPCVQAIEWDHVSMGTSHLPARLRAFREAYPRIDVVVCTGGSRDVTALVVERERDLGLVTAPVEHPGRRVCPLFEEETALAAPPGPQFACGGVTPDALLQAPLILPVT